MASISALKDANMERPPFYIPQRFKLLFQLMQDHKNCHRLGRKPMPNEVKAEMGRVLKEYNEFKVAEKTLLDLERGKMLQVQMKALDAIVFLPDYLIQEAFSDTGEQADEDMNEFLPGTIYLEQIMQMFPPE